MLDTLSKKLLPALEEYSRYEEVAIDNLSNAEPSDRYREQIRRLISEHKAPSSFREKLAIPDYRRKVVLTAVLVVLLLALTACGVKYAYDWFTITHHDKGSNFEYEDTGIKGIEAYYEPAAIPESFIQSDKTKNSIANIIVYQNDQDNRIIFKQILLANGWFSLNTENKEYGERNIDNIQVFYAKGDDEWSVVWRNEFYRFLIHCPSSFTWEEVEELVLSVKPEDGEASQVNK